MCILYLSTALRNQVQHTCLQIEDSVNTRHCKNDEVLIVRLIDRPMEKV
jgi:hypothetical protein